LGRKDEQKHSSGPSHAILLARSTGPEGARRSTNWRCKDLKPGLLPTLYKLAELGALHGAVEASTTSLAKDLSISQQTVSRHLIDLERQGLITRQPYLNGSEIRITEGGSKELRRIYMALKAAFEETEPITIMFTGRVFTGLGEGAYYVDKTDYGRHIEDALGFKPYPGTLNLRLSPSEVSKKKELEAYAGIMIRGFTTGDRSFGGVKCFKASIDEIEGALILIGRTHYDASVVELIAPVNLRERLGLKDRSRVRVIVRAEGDRDAPATRTTSPK
jgi:riboflavin kinase